MALSEIERKQALERFRLLEPHFAERRELRSVSEGSGISFRTLQRWVQQKGSSPCRRVR